MTAGGMRKDKTWPRWQWGDVWSSLHWWKVRLWGLGVGGHGLWGVQCLFFHSWNVKSVFFAQIKCYIFKSNIVQYDPLFVVFQSLSSIQSYFFFCLASSFKTSIPYLLSPVCNVVCTTYLPLSLYIKRHLYSNMYLRK